MSGSNQLGNKKGNFPLERGGGSPSYSGSEGPSHPKPSNTRQALIELLLGWRSSGQINSNYIVGI